MVRQLPMDYLAPGGESETPGGGELEFAETDHNSDTKNPNGSDDGRNSLPRSGYLRINVTAKTPTFIM